MCAESYLLLLAVPRGVFGAEGEPLSPIIILSVKSLCASRRHEAPAAQHSGSPPRLPPRQVMEASLAQTRCECVLTAERAAPLSGRQTRREGFGKRWLVNVLGLRIRAEGGRSVSDSSSSPSEQRASPDYRYTQMTAPVVEVFFILFLFRTHY